MAWTAYIYFLTILEVQLQTAVRAGFEEAIVLRLWKTVAHKAREEKLAGRCLSVQWHSCNREDAAPWPRLTLLPFLRTLSPDTVTLRVGALTYAFKGTDCPWSVKNDGVSLHQDTTLQVQISSILCSILLLVPISPWPSKAFRDECWINKSNS